MTSEQLLIQQINQFAERRQFSGNDAIIADYAQQYAELGENLLIRLQRCSDFIDQGMLTEAVYEASLPPALPETAKLMKFPQFNLWQNLCNDLQHPFPPDIPEALIQKIDAACRTEKDLSPLLKDYRTCIYQGKKREAIAILRRLRVLDPENPNWTDNLQRLEEEEYDAQIQEAEQALKTGNKEAIIRIYHDFASPQRLVPVDNEHFIPLKQVWLEEQSSLLFSQAEELLPRLREAMQNSDTATIGRIMRNVQTLTHDEAFLKRPDGWDNLIRQAQTLLNDLHSLQETQRRLDSLADEAAKHLTYSPLNENELADDERKITELLSTDPRLGSPVAILGELKKALADFRLKRLTRRILLGCGSAAAVVIVIILGWLIMNQVSRNQRRNLWFSELDDLIQGDHFTDFPARLQEYKSQDPGFAALDKTKALSQQFNSRQQDFSAHLLQWDNLKNQLQNARQKQFLVEYAKLHSLLEKAYKQASTQEERRFLDEWNNEWQGNCDKLTESASATQAELQNTIGNLLGRLQVESPDLYSREEYNITDLTKQVGLLAKQVSALSNAKLARNQEILQASLEELDRNCQNQERLQAGNLQQQENNQRRADAIIAKLPVVLPDTAQYAALLRELISLDRPESQPFKTAAEQLAIQVNSLALGKLLLEALPPEQEETREALLKLSQADTGVWQPLLAEAVRPLTESQQITAEATKLFQANEQMYKVYTLQYTLKGQNNWRSLYFPEMLHTQEQFGVKIYFGNIYYAMDETMAPILIHSSQVFKDNGLNLDKYDLKVFFQAEDNQAPQWKFLDDFFTRCRRNPEIDLLILEALQKLNRDDTIPLAPRLWLQKQFYSLIRKYYPEIANILPSPSWNPTTDIPWINDKHPETIKLAELYQQNGPLFADEKIADAIADRRSRQQWLKLNLNIQMSPVGIMMTTMDGHLSPFFIDDYEGEVWILDSKTASDKKRPYWRCLGKKVENRAMLETDNLFPGQILMAPANPDLNTADKRRNSAANLGLPPFFPEFWR